MSSLRRSLRRHPLAWFFLLAPLPGFLLGLASTNTWLSGPLPFSGMAAMIVFWAGDANVERGRSFRLRRAAIVVASGLVIVVTFYLVDLLGGAGGLSLHLLAPLVASALACGFVLSAVYSPHPGVRGLLRSLLRFRAGRSAYLVALLAWPLLAAIVIFASNVLPAQTLPGADSSSGVSAGLLLTSVAGAGLGSVIGWLFLVSHVVGWYGLAAKRLLSRLSLLETGLVIGCLALAGSLVIDLVHGSLSGEFALLYGANNAAALALVIVAVWVYSKSQGSLLPVSLLLSVASPMSSLVLNLAGSGLGSFTGPLYGLDIAACLLALVFVAGGKMWRRPLVAVERLSGDVLTVDETMG